MKVKVKIAEVYEVTGTNGKTKEFKKTCGKWNGFIELTSAENQKLILIDDSRSDIEWFSNIPSKEREYEVVKATHDIISYFDLVKD